MQPRSPLPFPTLELAQATFADFGDDGQIDEIWSGSETPRAQQLSSNAESQRRRNGRGKARRRLTRAEMDLRSKGFFDSTSSENEDYNLQVQRLRPRPKAADEQQQRSADSRALRLLDDGISVDGDTNSQVESRGDSTPRILPKKITDEIAPPLEVDSDVLERLEANIDEAYARNNPTKSEGTIRDPVEIRSSSPLEPLDLSGSSDGKNDVLHEQHAKTNLATVEQPRPGNNQLPLCHTMEDRAQNECNPEQQMSIQKETWGHVYFTRDSEGKQTIHYTKTWEQLGLKDPAGYSSSSDSETSDGSSVDEARKRKRRTKQGRKGHSKKKSKQLATDDIIGSLRPAYRPPPKLWLPPREMRNLGLKGLAELEGDKFDPAYDPDVTNPWFRHSRHIARTDGRDNVPKPPDVQSSIINRTRASLDYPDEPIKWTEAAEHNRLPFAPRSGDEARRLEKTDVSENTVVEGVGKWNPGNTPANSRVGDQ